MRWLFIPTLAWKRIRSNSNFIVFSETADKLISLGHWVYFVLPEYARDKVEDKPGLTYFFVPQEYDFESEWPVCNDRFLLENFSHRIGRYPVDAVFLSNPTRTPVVQAIISDSRRKDVPVVLFEQGRVEWVADKNVGASKKLAALGYAQSLTWILTPWQFKVYKQFMLRHVTGSVFQDWAKRVTVLPQGFDQTLVWENQDGQEKSPIFTLFWSGRFGGYKGQDFIFPVYEKFMAKYPARCEITTGNNAAVAKAKLPTEVRHFIEGATVGPARSHNPGSVTVHYNLRQTEYIKYAKHGDVMITASPNEAWPTGSFEPLYLGCPIIFIGYPWLKGILPDWYPYIVGKSESEAFAMILRIYENPDEVKDVIKRLREEWFPKYDSKTMMPRWIDQAKKLSSRDGMWKVSDGIGTVITECASALSEDGSFTLDELNVEMGERAKHWKVPLKNRYGGAAYSTPTMYDAYRFLKENGYVDTMDATEIRLARGMDG